MNQQTLNPVAKCAKVHRCLRADVYDFLLEHTDLYPEEIKLANKAVKVYGEINEETY